MSKVLTPSQLLKAGFSPQDLADAGLDAKYLQALKGAMTPAQRAALEAAIKAHAAAVTGTICSPENIQAYLKADDSLDMIRKKGCSLAQMKKAGISADQLEKAFGLSPAQLKELGYNAAQLLKAGLSPEQLRKAGFTAAELKGLKDPDGNSLVSPNEMKQAGFTASDLKNADFPAKDLIGKDGQLIYPIKTLRNAGYNAGELNDAGIEPGDLIGNGFTNGDLGQQGLDPQGNDLTASCDPQALARAFRNNEPVAKFKNCSISALKNAGYTAAQLEAAGIGNAAQLAAAGYSPDEISQAGYPGAGSLTKNNASTPQPGTNPNNQGASGASGQGASGASSQGASGPSTQTELQRARDEMNRQMLAQQRQALIQQKQGLMSAVAANYVDSWQKVSNQAVSAVPDVKAETSAQAAAMSASSSNAGGPIIKAGTMMYAILNSSIDSDDNLTKAYATIVSGPMKGAKLIGSFKLAGLYSTKLMLTFDTLDLPNLRRTIPIQAVAVDPETSHVALSGNVDNHFWQRYGVMFMGSFVQGVSEGLMAATSNTTVVDTTGKVTPWYNKIDAGQLGITGLGQVGSAVAKSMQKYTNRLPTVDVPGGTGIGILLYKDLELPPGSLTEDNVNGL